MPQFEWSMIIPGSSLIHRSIVSNRLSFIPRWTYCQRFANSERTKNIQKFFLLAYDWEIISESLWFLGQLLPSFRLLFSLCFSPFVRSSLPKLGSSRLNEFDYNQYSYRTLAPCTHTIFHQSLFRTNGTELGRILLSPPEGFVAFVSRNDVLLLNGISGIPCTVGNIGFLW